MVYINTVESNEMLGMAFEENSKSHMHFEHSTTCDFRINQSYKSHMLILQHEKDKCDLLKGNDICLRCRHLWICLLFRFYLSLDKVGTNAASNYWSNHRSMHLVPLMTSTKWTKARWNAKLAQHMTSTRNPPLNFWSCVQCPVHSVVYCQR